MVMIKKRRKIHNFSPPPTFAQKASGPQIVATTSYKST